MSPIAATGHGQWISNLNQDTCSLHNLCRFAGPWSSWILGIAVVRTPMGMVLSI